MNSMRDYSEQDWQQELDRIQRDDCNADWLMFFIGALWSLLCVWLAFSV